MAERKRAKKDSKKLQASVNLSPAQIRSIQKALTRWFSFHGRSYPWRNTDNWFHLLIAEMMLRRTRSDQVLEVYDSFTATYRTAMDADAMEEEELARLLYPLGLRWRAEQIRQTIRYVSHTYGRVTPEKGDDFLHIPGVGDYSSAMLRSRLFHEAVVAMDTNVARILARVAGISYHAESRRNRTLIELGGEIVKCDAAGDINLAFIDLAAVLCKIKDPRCGECPLKRWCQYARRNHAE